MGVLIVAIVFTFGKQLYQGIKADVKKRWLFNVGELSFEHLTKDQLGTVRELCRNTEKSDLISEIRSDRYWRIQNSYNWYLSSKKGAQS